MLLINTAAPSLGNDKIAWGGRGRERVHQRGKGMNFLPTVYERVEYLYHFVAYCSLTLSQV